MKFIYIFFILTLVSSCTNNNDKEENLHKDNTIQKNNMRSEGKLIKGLKEGVWKQYSDSGKLISVELYNNNNKLFDLDTVDFNFKDFEVTNEIYLNIPKAWKLNPLKDKSILFSIQKKCTDSQLFCPNMTLVKDSLQSDLSFEEYLNLNLDYLNNSFDAFSIVAKGNISINDCSAFQTTYTMLSQGVKLGGITTWIKKGDYIYIFSGAAINQKNSEFLIYKDLFQFITNSLTFK